MRTSAVPAPLLAVGGIVSVQIGGAIASSLIDRIGAPGAVFLRLGIGVVVLMALARPKLRGRSGRDWATVAAFGIAIGMTNLSFYQALARLPLGVAVTIEFIGPLGLAAALSRRRFDLAAVAVAAIGVVLVNGHELGEVNWVGVGFGLGAAVGWAAYILLSAETGRRFAQLDGLALAMVFGTALALPWGVLTAGSQLLDPQVLLVGASIALLSAVLPFSLELLALRRMRPAAFGVLMSLEPAVGALAGLVVLHQRLGAVQIAGMGCVVAASIAISRRASVADDSYVVSDTP